MDFQIGDRVRCVVDYPDGNRGIVVGSMGTIVELDTYVGVDWDDELENGHSCDGSARRGHGWNVEYEEIELIEPESDFADDSVYDFDESQFHKMLGL